MLENYLVLRLVLILIGINSHKWYLWQSTPTTANKTYPHQNPTKQMQITRPLVSASPLHFDSQNLAANVVKQITRASSY